jgi:hypothetical protein
MWQSDSALLVDVEAALREVIERRCPPPWDQEVRGTIPHLAALLSVSHDRSMEGLVDVIRDILVERCQLDEGGDALFHDDGILGQVALMLAHELERLRCQGVHRGYWSSDAAPEPMCG